MDSQVSDITADESTSCDRVYMAILGYQEFALFG